MSKLNKIKTAKLISIKDAATLLGVSTKTLRRWEDAGKLVPERTSGGHRRYLVSKVTKFKTSKVKKTTPTVSATKTYFASVPQAQVSPVLPVTVSYPEIKATQVESQPKYTTENIYQSLHIDQKKIFTKAIGFAVVIVALFGLVKLAQGSNLLKIAENMNLNTQFLSFNANDADNTLERSQVLASRDSLLSSRLEIGITTNFAEDVNIAQNLAVAGDVNITGTTDATIVNATDIGANNLVLAEDLTVGGIAVITGNTTVGSLTLGEDTFTDLTGAGLQITDGVLETTLGTSITSAEITDGSITEADLSITNTPTDNQVLTYDAASGTFSWAADSTGETSPMTLTSGVVHPDATTDDLAVGGTTSAAPFFVDSATGEVFINSIGLNDIGSDNTTSGASLIGVFDEFSNSSATTLQDVLDDFDSAIGGGASKFTQDTGFAYLTSTTDQLVIGGSSSLSSKLAVDGDADEIQLLIQANATQTSDLVVFETSAGSDLFTLNNSGNLTLAGSLTIGGEAVSDFSGNGIVVSGGAITVDLTVATDALSATTSTGSGLEVLASGLTLIQGCANGEVLKWNEANDSWECSTDSGAAFAVVNVENNDVAVGVNVDSLDFSTDFSVTASPANEANISIADDIIDFTEIDNTLTLDEATDIALGALTLSTSGTGALDFNSTGLVSFAGNVDAENGLDVTGASLTIGGSYSITTGGVITAATDETINGVDINAGAVSDVTTLTLTTASNSWGASGLTVSVGADITMTAGDDFVFDDAQLTSAITLTDTDTDFDSGDTAIVDAINTVYGLATGGSSKWTVSGTDTYLTTTTNDVIIGGAAALSGAKLSIDGDADQIQFLVQGNATQTSNLVTVEQSDGTDVLTLSNAGRLSLPVNGSAAGIALGATTNLQLYFNGTDSILDSNNGNLELVGAGDIRINADNDTDDYIFFSTESNVPIIRTAGTTSLTIAPDGGLVDVTGNIDASGTLTSGTANAFTVSATGVISTITDETINGIDISAGAISDVTTLNASGTITGGTLTDGAASISGGAGTGFVSLIVDSLTLDGTTLSSSGSLSLTSAASGDIILNASDDFSFDDAQLTSAITLTDTAVDFDSGDTAIVDAINTAYNAATGGGGAGVWTLASNALYPTTVGNKVGIGTTTAATIISKLYVTGNSTLTGKSVAIFNQTEAEDVLTASSSGTPVFVIANNGDVNIRSTVANSDRLSLVPYNAGSNTFTGDITTSDLTADRTWTLPDEDGTVCLSSGNCAGGAGGSKWTDDGSVTYLTGTTDELVLGGSTALSSAKLSIDGDADQIQLIVQGNATQTSNLLTLEQSDGTDVFTVTNAGLISANDLTLALADGSTVNIDGDGTPTADLLQIGSGDTSSTDGVDALQLTFGVSAASGSVIDITPSYADATAGTTSETYNIIDIDAFTATQNASTDTGLIRGLNIGNLTQTETSGTITATALNLGTGWDSLLSYNGTTVINGSGQLVSTQITGTLFTAAGDTGSQAVVQGNTLTLTGGTGIATAQSGLANTLSFDCSEVEGTDIDCSGESITLESTVDTISTLNLAGTGTINGLDAVDATGENTIEALIFDTDAETITGVWTVADSVNFAIGTGNDLTLAHNGTNSLITSTTGDLIIDNTLATGSSIFRLGTDTSATDFQIQNNSESPLFTVDGAGTGTLAGDLTISGADLTIGTILLDGAGTDNITSGASLIGTFDEFANSNSVTVQDVLDDLDAAIGAGASKWTQGTGLIYLTTTTDEVIIGGSSSLSSKLAIDGDNDEIQLKIQGNATQTNNLLTLEQSDGTDVFTVTNAGNVTALGNLQTSTLNFETSGAGIITRDSGSISFGSSININANLSETFVAGTGNINFSGFTPNSTNGALNVTANQAHSVADSRLINLSGSAAISGSAKTAYGIYSSIANTGNVTNVAGYFSAASGTDANYGLIVANGNVGIGDTSPTELLTVGSGELFTVNNSGVVTAVGNVNANGGLDVDDAFVVADGGVLTTSQTANFDGTVDVDGAADFSAGLTNSAGELLISGGNLQLNDSLVLSLGTDDDLTLTHNGTTAIIDNNTGELQFVAASNIRFSADNDTDDYVYFSTETNVPFLRTAGTSNLNIAPDGGTTTVTGNLTATSLITGADLAINLTDGSTATINGDGTPTVDVLSLSSGTSSTDGVDALQLTFGVSAASGNVIDITPSYADATAGATSETYNIIDIDAFTATQNATGDTGVISALNIGNLTQTETAGTITATALNLGTGWDSLLSYNGTPVINGTGQLVSTQLTGTLFTITDGSTPQTIEQGNTLTFVDGTDNDFVTSATDQVTVNNTSTLSTVTGRGATTTTAVSLNGGFNVDAAFSVADGGILTTSQTANFDGTADFDGATDFSAGLTNSAGELLISGGNIQLNDNINLTVGTGDDLTISHNGTNSLITSATGDLIFDNTLVTGSTIFDLGTDTSATDFQIRNNTGTPQFTITGAGLATFAGNVDATNGLDVTGASLTVGGANASISTSGVLALSSGGTSAINLTRSSAGQWIGFNDGTDAWGLYNTAGSPEGVLAANTGALSMDTTNGTLYVKTDDTDNTGWVNLATGGTSPWTDSGTTTYLTDTTDELVLGGSSPLSSAKFSIDGDADQIQLIVQGNATQTSNLLTLEQSDGTDVFTVTNAGVTTTIGNVNANGGLDIDDVFVVADGGAVTANTDVDLVLASAENFVITSTTPTVDVISGALGTSTTDGVDGLQLTFGVSAASGNVIDITPSYADATAGTTSETYNIIDIDAFTATQNALGDTGIISALNIGNLTQTETAGTITATALNLGTGWDTEINLSDTTPTISIGDTGTLTINDGTNSLFTFADNSNSGNLSLGDLTLGLNDATALITTFDTDENLNINPNGAGDVTFHGATYQISNTGDLTIGGRIEFENGEFIDNETNGSLDFNTPTANFIGTSTIASDQTTVAFLNATTTTVNAFSATTALNIADAAITGTIDIGGVTADGASTINIATEGTSADVITVGNSNASTTVAITGGDDWSISAAGDFTGENLILSSAGTTSIDLTRTSAGQWLGFNDGTDIWGLYNTAGSPEGVLAANTGALSMDTTNGTLYVKTDDTDNTGWVNLATGGTSPFESAGGIITKTTIGDRLSLRYGEAADIQFELENTTNTTIPTVDAAVINLSGNTTGIVTDGVDGLYMVAEFGDGTTNTNSLLHLDVDPIAGSGDEFFYALNIDGITGTGATERAIGVASGWDTSIYLAGGTTGIGFAGTYTTGIDLSGASSTVDLILDDGLTIAQTANNDLTFTENSLSFNYDFGEVASTIQLETASSFDIESTANAADAITLVSTVGGIDITATGASAGEDIDITASSSINLSSSEAVNDAIVLSTSNAAGGIDITSSSTTVDALDFTADSLTTGIAMDISVDGLTTGKGINLQSTTTSTSFSGDLAYIEWAPGSATAASGDLFQINIGTNGSTTGKLFRITDTGSDLFAVSESVITSSLPHEFTAAGDVSVAYDIAFTNQTASFIKSNAPLQIEAGEIFESNNLTFKTYNSGDIVFDVPATGAAIVQGAFSVDAQQAFTSTDTTPSVAAGSHFITANGSATVITAFDDGTAGQIIYLEINDSNTDIDCTSNSNFNCGSGGDIDNLAAGDFMHWIYDGSVWNLLGWMDASSDYGVAGGADVAEFFPASEVLEAGDLVAIDGLNPVTVKKGTQADGQKVIGIVSTQPGLTLGEQEGNSAAVALVGRVPVKVTNTSEAIQIGDLIGASEIAGHAKKVTGGYIVGRALEAWTPGTEDTDVMVFVNPIYVAESAQNVELLESRISTLESSFELMNASGSANLSDLTVTSINVLGDAILGDTVVNGKLNVGTIEISNIDNSVNAIGTLKIQNLALGNIEFLGGLITFDTDGNIVAKEITAEKYSVAGASAGKTTLPAGDIEIYIESDQVTADSLIFVTAETQTPRSLSVTDKVIGQGFTVTVSRESINDIMFSWFIVDKKN